MHVTHASFFVLYPAHQAFFCHVQTQKACVDRLRPWERCSRATCNTYFFVVVRRLLHSADSEAMRGMSPEDYPLQQNQGNNRGQFRSKRQQQGASSNMGVGGRPEDFFNRPSEFTPSNMGVGGRPEDFFNRPSEFTPPEADRSYEFYNKPSEHADPAEDDSWEFFNNRDAVRNCVGGGEIGCCPDWAQKMGLCPPEITVPEPMHWWANLDN
jgi:hypothetical protein